MLQELSHMDRITQLQDEIQQVRPPLPRRLRTLTSSTQLLTIMSNTIAYLTTRANFVQVSQEIPITKSRNAAKYDQPDAFEGQARALTPCCCLTVWLGSEQGGACQ